MEDQKTYLQEFYETQFKLPNMDSWESLTKEQREDIRGLTSYSTWRFKVAMDEAILSIGSPILDTIHKAIS